MAGGNFVFDKMAPSCTRTMRSSELGRRNILLTCQQTRGCTAQCLVSRAIGADSQIASKNKKGIWYAGIGSITGELQ